MIGWLNLGSLLLGLVALVLPIVILMKNTKYDNGTWFALSFSAFVLVLSHYASR